MSELHILPASAIAFAVTAAFMVALRPVAMSIGLVDRPGGRKLHIGNIPIIGGLAMFLGIVAGLVAIGVVSRASVSLVFSLFLLVMIGAFDDRYSVSALVRVVVQIAAILIMAYGSESFLFSIGDPFGVGEIHLGPLTLASTIIVALTVINAYNLVDGVDGLAGMLAVIALIAVAVVGGFSAISTYVALIVASSIGAFLLFNFPVIANRAVRSFMGDAGSTLLGFTIFWVTLSISQGESAIISPVIGLWFAAIPVFDSLTCFVMRLIAGKSPFQPGRDHFHHTLKRGGFGVRQTLGILSGLQMFYAILAIVAHYLGVFDVALFVTWSLLGLTQRWVIKSISLRHRLYLFRQLRAGGLGPYRQARARALR